MQDTIFFQFENQEKELGAISIPTKTNDRTKNKELVFPVQKCIYNENHHFFNSEIKLARGPKTLGKSSSSSSKTLVTSKYENVISNKTKIEYEGKDSGSKELKNKKKEIRNSELLIRFFGNSNIFYSDRTKDGSGSCKIMEGGKTLIEKKRERGNSVNNNNIINSKNTSNKKRRRKKVRNLRNFDGLSCKKSPKLKRRNHTITYINLDQIIVEDNYLQQFPLIEVDDNCLLVPLSIWFKNNCSKYLTFKESSEQEKFIIKKDDLTSTNSLNFFPKNLKISYLIEEENVKQIPVYKLIKNLYILIIKKMKRIETLICGNKAGFIILKEIENLKLLIYNCNLIGNCVVKNLVLFQKNN